MAARKLLILVLLLTLISAGIGILGCGEAPFKRPEAADPRVPGLDPAAAVTGIVRDDYANQPIEGADVALGDKRLTTDDQGNFPARKADDGAALTISRAGYDNLITLFDGNGSHEYRLRPNLVRGRVVDDENGQPLSGVSVFHGERFTTTDAQGEYSLAPVGANARLMLLLSGYARERIEVGRSTTVNVRLKRQIIKGAYLSFYAAGWQPRRDQLLSLIDNSELNAVVIDVKGDVAKVLYPTNVSLAREIGADEKLVDDIDGLLADLKKRQIYTIARIVVFKDDLLAKARPEWAVQMTNGGPFIDWEDLRWTDPFRREVWEYNIALAEEAARHGFDEVQFDYVRFPTDGDVGNVVYSQQSTDENRQAALEGFLALARARLRPLGVFISADTFGWTLIRQDDMGIGQHIEAMAQYLDYLSPMVYPSTWGPGSLDVPYPPAAPGDIVQKSVGFGVERLKPIPTIKVRAWLQDFDDYGPRKLSYNAPEVRAQIDAATAAGSYGWLLWNSVSLYTGEALGGD